MKSLLCLILFVGGLVAPGFADGIPDLDNSYVTCAYQGTGMVSLLVQPNGEGAAFTEARDPEGNLVDATLTLVVLDGGDFPIPHFPAEDMWLEALDGGLVPCTGGTTADGDTDLDGATWFVNPLRAGGFSEAGLRALVNGNHVSQPPVLPIVVNSPDISGDGAVNLVDVSMFMENYFGDYHFRSDFFHDGVINLADVSQLAAGLGAQCP